MGLPATPLGSGAFCAKCGTELSIQDKSCPKCGTATTFYRPKGDGKEFDRSLRIAYSCFKDAKSKINEILHAKEAGDREVNRGKFRSTIAMSTLQSRFEKEFEESLNMAWKHASKASEIDPSGGVEIDDLEITPNSIFAGVCGLRGELRLALDKWDEAVAFYNAGLQHVPDNSLYYYNIGVAYTNKHAALQAISAFEKVIELNPTGQTGIEAAKNVERLKSGSIGKKAFTGSWIILLILLVFALGSLILLPRYWKRKFR